MSAEEDRYDSPTVGELHPLEFEEDQSDGQAVHEGNQQDYAHIVRYLSLRLVPRGV